jgi:hypothetical protein
MGAKFYQNSSEFIRNFVLKPAELTFIIRDLPDEAFKANPIEVIG